MSDEPVVFVVDDDLSVLSSMRWLLESERLTVETFESAKDFLAQYQPHRPGCLILDVRMLDMDGLELQSRLAARGRHLPVIFVTGHGTIPQCTRAMKAGAVDFLEKPVSDDVLIDLVHQSLERDSQRRRIEAAHPEVAGRIDRLTPRERDVLHLVYAGKPMKIISGELRISVQTVAKHRTRVLQKLGVQNEVELTRLLDQKPRD